MRSILRCLKIWIAYWRPSGEMPIRLRHYLAAGVTVPIFFLVYVLMLLFARLRGPFRMEGTIPCGATLNCQLPDAVQFCVFLFGVWEPDISAFVRRRLSVGDTFCDVGAHVGYYSLLAAATVGKSGHVVAIEASPTIFNQLQENLSKNGTVNVRALNVAATAKAGVLKVHRGPDWNLGWTTTHANCGLPLECEVPALPLEDILTADERRTVRLIKVDVEGTERELFAGLGKLLRNGRPDLEVILEVSPRWWKEPQASIEQALLPFVDLGFHIYRVNNDYSPWRYFWSDSVRAPQRVHGPIKSWIGQVDVVLSREDREEL